VVETVRILISQDFKYLYFRFWSFFSELQSSGLLSNLQNKDYLEHNLTGQLYFFFSRLLGTQDTVGSMNCRLWTPFCLPSYLRLG